MMLPMAWAEAQGDVAFTNFWQFQSFYNPAAAGRSGLLDINGAYRMEMLGFEDAGQTMLIQGDLPMFFVPKAERHGMGAGFMNDKIGLFSNIVPLSPAFYACILTPHPQIRSYRSFHSLLVNPPNKV